MKLIFIRNRSIGKTVVRPISMGKINMLTSLNIACSSNTIDHFRYFRRWSTML